MTYEQYDTALTWCEARKDTEELPDEVLDDSDTEYNDIPSLVRRKDSDDSDTECEQMREPILINKYRVSFATPLMSKIIQHEKKRESRIGSSVGSTVGSKTSRHSLSNKTRELNTNNKSRDDSGNAKPSTSQPFVDIAPIGLRRGKRTKKRSQILEHPLDVKKKPKTVYGILLIESYNTLLYTYDDFLELNFDGTQNSLSPLVQIYYINTC